MPSNRNFGITFFFIFVFLSILFRESNILKYFLILSVLFLILGTINSLLLYPLNFIWYKFGIFLSKIMSPIILFIVFYGIFCPYGFLYKILYKNNVFGNSKIFTINKNKKNSYWVQNYKKNNKQNFKEQY